MPTKFWSEYLKGRDVTEDLVVDGTMLIRWVWIGFRQLRLQTSSGLLKVRY